MSKIFALVTLLICILNGCQTIREKASGPEFENAKLTAIIKAQLAREDQATLQAVTVDVNDGVAKLKGTVSSAEKKAKAEEIARKVDGGKRWSTTWRSSPDSQKIASAFFFQIRRQISVAEVRIVRTGEGWFRRPTPVFWRPRLGLRLQSLEVRSSNDFDSAFEAALRERAQALAVSPEPLISTALEEYRGVRG